MTTTRQGFAVGTAQAYDAIATEYAEAHARWLDDEPLDRALVAAFAELAAAQAPAPVADLGSGPGYVTAHLHGLGVPVFGVDVSPRMVEHARRTYPDLRFHIGSMLSLELPDGTLGGAVALYSIIHIPDDHLVRAFEEIGRVLRPGALVLLSFQTGEEDEHVHLSERFGRRIALDYYLRTTRSVTEALAKAGLELRARTVREAGGEEVRARAFVLAARPVS
ncbi:class I SAM-dependent methyltransferase [Streptomyces sp. NPDC048290]|uniref:class I SAM-dependent methyltransferase n=1 Tax=Streptomyces sp. NPDC048290 TaxID=3155811 RepID=UPI0034152B48